MIDPQFLFVLEADTLVQTMDGVEVTDRVAVWGVSRTESERDDHGEQFHGNMPAGDCWIPVDDVLHVIDLTDEEFRPIDPTDLL